MQGQQDRDSRQALGRAYYEVGELTRNFDSIEEAQVVLRRAMTLFQALSHEDPADAGSRRALALCLRSRGANEPESHSITSARKWVRLSRLTNWRRRAGKPLTLA